ncbi:peptidase S8, partial [filamentous cyanobacterium CCP5]
GGEELRVKKLSDRLTTRLSDPSALESLRERIQPTAMRAVGRGELLEWTLPADRLEAALALARSDAAVRFASHVYYLADSPHTWLYLSDQVTVQFAPGTSEGTMEAIANGVHLDHPQPLEGIPLAYVYETGREATENPIKIANRLMRHPEVLTAEPNMVVRSEGLYRPRDKRYAEQWHLAHAGGYLLEANSHIHAEAAWDITRGSRSVVIAISDDGFDLDHPDLQGSGKLVAPTDLKDKDALPLPVAENENHGTAVAGLAIGEENGSGIVGVAPGCGFMPIRTTGFLDDRSIEQLFDSAIAAGAAVISCSWSPAAVYFPLTLRQRSAITRAATQGRNGKGCVVIFSAGNANRPLKGTVNEKGWPQQAISGKTEWLSGFAVPPDVIAVSASTSLNRKAAYSNWGTHISVAAPSNNGAPNMALPPVGSVSTGPTLTSALPGRGMVTSDRTQASGYSPDSYTNSFGGTSSACPVVAGVVGLMLSVNPQLTAQQVRQILQSTADKIVDVSQDPQLGLRHGTYDTSGHSQWFGYGKVNAHRAVAEAQRQAAQTRVASQTLEFSSLEAVEIPDDDLGGVGSAIQVLESGQLQDIQARVEIDHDFLGDLAITLESPDGSGVLLQGRTLGGQTQLRQTYTLMTTPALLGLLNQPARGAWRLGIVDHAPGATGKLLRWDLTLGIS